MRSHHRPARPIFPDINNISSHILVNGSVFYAILFRFLSPSPPPSPKIYLVLFPTLLWLSFQSKMSESMITKLDSFAIERV